MKIHLLDVGRKQYGDCILVVEGPTTVLIDGAHRGDDVSSGEFASIPDQLRSILGVAAGPIPLSLLVVTHCHSDHIGCLPEMVAQRIIAPEVALVADENIGYGLAIDENPFDGLSPEAAALLVSLQEEPPSATATDAQVQRFIQDAADSPQRYRAMLAALQQNGTRLIRYRGIDADVVALQQQFSTIGLTVLGPSTAHLLACTEVLHQISLDAGPAIDSMLASDANLASAYRTLAFGHAARDDILIPDAVLDFLDAGSAGAAKNNQSIVIAVGRGANRVLLTGDMQFARPEVTGLADEMSALLTATVAAGPYAFIKLPHHAAANGFDAEMLQAFRETRSYGISTGVEGMHHPNRGVLSLLKNAQPPVDWSRTDRNGHITVEFSRGRATMTPQRNQLNDPQPKVRDDAPAPVPPPPLPTPIAPPPVVSAAPPGPVAFSVDAVVEITARIPAFLPSVTITVDIAAPRGATMVDKAQPDPPAEQHPLARGRKVPPLLFVTDRQRLERKIGTTGYQRVRQLIGDGNQKILEVANAASPFSEIRRAGADAAGVVILGDADVVPSLIYDVLPPDIRRRVDAHGDPDRFVVWSDQLYGDLDGDSLADVPVSRVPDCGSADFLLKCLTAGDRRDAPAKFAVRNAQRPFAANIFSTMPGNGAMLISGPDSTRSVAPGHFSSAGLYFMLHGSDSDATRYWGEDAGLSVEALNLDAVPSADGATVVTGCCWGALTVGQVASRATDHWAVSPRNPQSSLALHFLDKGALAYLGCTGAHYSPLAGRLDYFGEPMHRGIWNAYTMGASPAKALFDAKRAYINGMPHGRQTATEWAIEYKILRQYTCLGLGW